MVAKKAATRKVVAKKAVAKKVATRKVVAKKAVAKKVATKKVAAKKTAPPKPVAGKAAVRKIASKPAAAVAPKKPSPTSAANGKAALKAVSGANKPAARKRAPLEAPIHHISQEDAVAKIQALLEAKQERVQQGPSWPDANPSHPSSNGAEMHPPVSAEGGGEGGDGRVLAAQRGEQAKRKG